MDRNGVPSLAAELGVSLPTAHRLLDDLGVPRTGRGVPRVVSGSARRRAVERAGAVRVRAQDLGREDMLVLAALATAPVGFESLRALARAAGVSATKTSAAVQDLAARGLVRTQQRTVARGRAVARTFWSANYRGWDDTLFVAVHAVRLPKPAPRASGHGVPRRFWHLFWNATPSKLDTRTDGPYIAGRLLGDTDHDAFVWATRHLSPTDLVQAAAVRGTPRKVADLVAVVAR